MGEMGFSYSYSLLDKILQIEVKKAEMLMAWNLN